MKIRFALGPLPALVFYTNPGEGRGGAAQGPVIRIRPGYEQDEGLHQHELAHARQFWLAFLVGLAGDMALAIGARSGLASLPVVPWWVWLELGAGVGALVHPLLYLFFRRYRLSAEIEAYRLQMRFPDGGGGHLDLDGAARRLASPIYKFDITVTEAREALGVG